MGTTMIIPMTVRTLLALGCAALLTTACGDDDGGGGSSTIKRPPTLRARQAAPAPAAVAVGTYTKVDEELRHKFTEIDFIPDGTGETNRDPFRSWVLQPSLEKDPDGPKLVDVCTSKKVRWGASNYSIRDLQLIGLVKRGRSYAQFTDRSETDSWIVRKDDCIGQEKAIIEEIGVGYVRLSVTPPAPPGAPAPAPQKQNISLHPEELEIPDSIINETSED